MRVLASHPIRNDATCFYRIFSPLSALDRDGDIELIDGTGNSFEFSWATMLRADILYMGRPSTIDALHILQIAKLSGRHIWIDYDDDYLNIPESNPRHHLYADSGRQYIIKQCIELADVVSVSTDAIAKKIQDAYNKPCQVIPNAIDDSLFELPPKATEMKNPYVVWRGGDTHGRDLDLYKDDILKCIDDFPKYNWVFMGYVPLWITRKKDLPDYRLRLYGFEDLMLYFHMLLELRPEIMIVPLEDNQFNVARSNISWLEASLAGASVLGPPLPEFDRPGVTHYGNGLSFYQAFEKLTDQDFREQQYQFSIKHLPLLSEVNEKRKEIIRSLSPKRLYQKVVQLGKLNRFGNDEFYLYEKSHELTSTERYIKRSSDFVTWIIGEVKPSSVIELGCGSGVVLELMHKEKINAVGIDINPHFVSDFQKRNPLTADKVMCASITDELKFEEPFELGISIEVFEHIHLEEEKWNALILHLAKNVGWFYFSSTPYRSTIEFDHQWGHVNVRRYEKWIELFESNGWQFFKNPNKMTPWDILFKSRYVTFDGP